MYEAHAPAIHHAPQMVTPDTYVIRQLFGEGTAPVGVYVNAMVIKAKEPVIVDTGTFSNREAYLRDIFSLVDPKDVRWIFLSQDDHDHVGNAELLMQLCPNATLVTTWFMLERLAGDYEFPLNRVRWMNDGDALHVGDRTLYAVRPPVYDTPTTRGLFDAKTGVYWASDAFGTPVLEATEDVGDLDKAFWDEGFSGLQRIISPWFEIADAGKFNKTVDTVANLQPKVIATGHGPLITGANVAESMKMMREIIGQPAAPLLGQADLEALIAATMVAPAKKAA
ncbi:MAG: MBL fold metallo-hydrolase [Dehalococcoidia bacterium]